jgi:hypothetical protein
LDGRGNAGRALCYDCELLSRSPFFPLIAVSLSPR